MAGFEREQRRGSGLFDEGELATAQVDFMSRVYQHMGLGLLATAMTAMGVTQIPALWELTMRFQWVTVIALLVMVLVYGAMIERISSFTATVFFYAYATLTGLALSWIFLAYTSGSISSTFFVTAGTFGVMSFWGYSTKTDLTGLGHFMRMGLVGLILASVVNLFLQSPAITWVTTYVGIAVFVGLTAYDTQKIKRYGALADSPENAKKYAIHGALALYLDFVNLFLFLLRIFGRRR